MLKSITNAAINIAMESHAINHKHGAVIFKGAKKLSSANNSLKVNRAR